MPVANPNVPASTPDEIARVYRGFARGGAGEIEQVAIWIRGIVRRGNWRFADADGVAQDALVRLFEIARADRVKDPAGFKKFVFTVAKYTCTQTYYRERRRPDRLEAAPDDEAAATTESAHDDLEQRERLDAMIDVFQRLPDVCRTLWNLVYGEGLSQEQVAERMEITVNNVRVRVHRCLTKAREISRKLGQWPAERQA